MAPLSALKMPLFVTALILVAFVTGRFTAPGPKEVVKTEIVEVIKEVESKRKTDTKIVYVKEPNGKETTTTETKETEDTTTKEVAKIESQQKINATRDNWIVGAMVGVDSLAFVPKYGASIDYRLFGSAYLGAWGIIGGPAGARFSLTFP